MKNKHLEESKKLVSLEPFKQRVNEYQELLRKGVTQIEQLKDTFSEIQDFSFSKEAIEATQEQLRQQDQQTNQTQND